MSNVLKSLPTAWPPKASQPIPVAAAEVARVDEVDQTEMIDEAQLQADLQRMREESVRTSAELIEQSRFRALTIVADAESVAASIREDAHRAGYQDGLRMGREEAHAEFAQWKTSEVQKLAQLETDLIEQRKGQLRSLESVVTRLVIAATEKLIRRELALSPPDISAIVRDLLTYVVQGSSIQVRVHPDDYAVARQAHPQWAALKRGDWEIAVLPDPSLNRGDCEILSDTSRVDARIETRLEELLQTLEDLRIREGEGAFGTSS